MSYRYDSEPVDAYDFERSETAWARNTSPQTDCGDHHDYMPNRRGGGTCRYCGDELDREDLA